MLMDQVTNLAILFGHILWLTLRLPMITKVHLGVFMRQHPNAKVDAVQIIYQDRSLCVTAVLWVVACIYIIYIDPQIGTAFQGL